MKLNLPKLIGHRGVKDIAPENTILSINKAIIHNLKWIEVDVKISKDHIPFLLHDDLLDRTTNGKGHPYKYNYSQIKSLDAGSWFNKKYNELYPPKLEEILDICSKKSIGLNIELKPNCKNKKNNVLAITNLIKKYKYYDKYFFSSFDFYSIKELRKILPKASLGFLIHELNIDDDLNYILYNCAKIKCFAIGLNINLVDEKIIAILKDKGFKITVYSNKNIKPSKAKRLWKLGVNSIFIDNPISYKI